MVITVGLPEFEKANGNNLTPGQNLAKWFEDINPDFKYAAAMSLSSKEGIKQIARELLEERKASMEPQS